MLVFSDGLRCFIGEVSCVELVLDSCTFKVVLIRGLVDYYGVVGSVFIFYLERLT